MGAPDGFPANAHRYDPYKNFKFRILWGGKTILGVSKISALKRTTEVVSHRSGGQNSYPFKSKGRSTYDAITCERGVTHDLEFEKWADMTSTYAGDAATDLVDYKRELLLEFMNERGQVAIRYFLFGCWVSEYQALPDLDANANAVAIEHLKIEVEGWTRDPNTKEPNESDPVPPPPP
jgi:phage tail-like protein